MIYARSHRHRLEDKGKSSTLSESKKRSNKEKNISVPSAHLLDEHSPAQIASVDHPLIIQLGEVFLCVHSVYLNMNILLRYRDS